MEAHAEVRVSFFNVPCQCWRAVGRRITADWATGQKDITICIQITQLDCKQQNLCSFAQLLKYLTKHFVLPEKNGVSKFSRGHPTLPNDKFIDERGKQVVPVSLESSCVI